MLEVVKKLVEYKALKADLEDQLKEVRKKLDEVEEVLIQQVLNSGMKSVKFPGLGNFSLFIKEFPRIIDQDKFYGYLETSGQQEMIRKTVNAQTLRGWWNGMTSKPVSTDIGLEVYTQPSISTRKE